MELNYQRFREILRLNPHSFRPQNFFTRLPIDLKRYNQLEQKCQQSNNRSSSENIDQAFNQLKKRTNLDYFLKILTAQANSLGFSSTVFPAYRFLLPEVLVHDWLGIVDWHKFQRDHALHQPLTAYIVHELFFPINADVSIYNFLTELIKKAVKSIIEETDTAYLREYLESLGFVSDIRIFEKNLFSSFICKSMLFETAYIAALFHDIGYPWQLINTLSNKLDPLGLERKPSNDESAIYEMFHERLLYFPLNAYQKLNPGKSVLWKQELLATTRELLIKTHGFAGAICFLYLNDVLRLFPNAAENPLRQYCVDWAAMGIMMHDLSKIYWGNQKTPKNPHLRLKLNIDPLSTILTLCDVLQEFARPFSTFAPNEKSVNLEYDMPCKSTTLEIKDKNLDITFTYDDKYALAKKKSFLKNDEFEYFDPQHGYIDISSLGLSRVNLKVKYVGI